MRPRRRPAAADPAGCACVKDDDICTDSIISGMSLTMTHSSVAVQKRLGAIRSTVRQRHGFRIVQELEEVMGRVRQVGGATSAPSEPRLVSRLATVGRLVTLL